MAFIITTCLTLNAQSTYTEIHPDYKIPIDRERINVSTYASKYKGSILDYSYTEADGTQVQVKSYKRGSNIEVFEQPPLPALHTIYKEFHPNGNLKQKGVLLSRQLKIGKWLECDNRGNCNIIDYETNRGTYGYNEVLGYLEFRGYYNKKDNNDWHCSFWYTPETNTWGVRVNKNGHQYKMYTFDSLERYDIQENDLIPNTKGVVPTGTFIQKEE